MFKHRIVPLVVLALSLASQSAQAFFDPPRITPAMPREGEIVSVNIRGGICDSILERTGYPRITQQGNVIRILEYGDHRNTDELCIYPVGTLTDQVGAFSAGEYTLVVDFVYNDYLFGPTIINLGVIPFAVNGFPVAAPVPVLSDAGEITLVILIAVFALAAVTNGCLKTQVRGRA